ncbi:MAG: hypothetical protein RJB13_336 [Pseudomonadota bacterium]
MNERSEKLSSIVWSAARFDIILGMVMSPLHAVAEVALGFVSGALLQLIFSGSGEAEIDRIVPPTIAQHFSILKTLSREDLITLVPLLLTGIGFVRMLTSFGSNYLLERAGHRVAHSLRERFLGSYLHASGKVLDSRNPDEMTNRILLDTTLMQSLISKGTIGALRDGLVVIGTACGMLYVASQFFFYLILIFVPFFFMLRFVSAKLEYFTRESARRQIALATRGMQTRSGLQAIFGMGAQSREISDLTKMNASYYDFVKRTFLLRVGFKPAMEVLAVLILAGALQWRLNESADIDVASYSAVFVLAALSFRPLKNVSGFVSQFSELKAVWVRLSEEWKTLNDSRDHTVSLHASEAVRAGRAMSAKSVTYMGADGRVIVNNVSLDFNEGERVALLGVSGAGKSTMLRLLAGLLRPDLGSVTGSGNAVLATQFPYVFHGTVFENIIYPQRIVQQAEREVVRRRVLDLILTLMLAHTEAGAELFLNKKVGFMGEGLSGGERARVALARLLFADRPILLLDEPTANLDQASASAFWTAVWRWQKKNGSAHSVVAVTHDQTELSHFDVVCVFDDGQCVFRGEAAEARRFISTRELEMSVALEQPLELP